MRRSLAALAVAALAACSSATDPDDDSILPERLAVSGGDVTYTAGTAPSGDPAGLLLTTVVVRASGPGSSRLEYGGCPVEVQFFRTPARSGTAAWAQSRRGEVGCIQPLYVNTLAPGDTLHLTTGALPREVLGDSLPAGRYYATAVLRPNGRFLRLPAGEVELAR